MKITWLLPSLAILWTLTPGPAGAAAARDWLIDSTPYAAQAVTARDGAEIVLSNGLVRRVIAVRPAATTTSLDNLATGESLLRSVRAEAQVGLNGTNYDVGGLLGQPIHNYLAPGFGSQLTANPKAFHFARYALGRTQARFAWQKRLEWLPGNPPWPPPGVALTLEFESPPGAPEVVIAIHYELYDGLPLLAKWLTLSNRTDRPVRLNSVLVEQLAVVEPESIVDGSPANFRATYRNLEVFSDYAFGGDMTANADMPAVHWKSDPLYQTQVHYERQTPCLLECSLPWGPELPIAPGQQFESFRVFELVHDGTDRERRGLALRRAYRALAPWVQENPVLMHVRSAEPAAVRLAIDQCAELGFELVILTFGSGFDIENEKPEYLAQLKELADYARSKHIALGGYSLLASRAIDADNDVINPKTGKTGGARFGNSP